MTVTPTTDEASRTAALANIRWVTDLLAPQEALAVPALRTPEFTSPTGPAFKRVCELLHGKAERKTSK